MDRGKCDQPHSVAKGKHDTGDPDRFDSDLGGADEVKPLHGRDHPAVHTTEQRERNRACDQDDRDTSVSEQRGRDREEVVQARSQGKAGQDRNG